MRIGTATVRTVLLAMWAGLFVYLWLADEATRYLGPRTQWVIVFGAITLTLAAAAHAVYAFAQRPGRRVSRGEALGALALLVPLAAILATPRAELGAYAAERKWSTQDVVASLRPVARTGEVVGGADSEPSFAEVATVVLQPELSGLYGLAAGSSLNVDGLVVHRSGTSGTFGLARFMISCCVADAIPVIVPIDPGTTATPPQDTWLDVSGSLERRGGELVVAAREMTQVEAPETPYLTQ
jgi:putative membrane protein